MLRNHFIKSSTIEQPNYTIYYTADSKVPFIGGEQTRNLTMWETGYELEPLATFTVLEDSFADGYGLWSIKTSNPSCFYGLIKDKNGSEYSMDSGNTNIITGLIFPDYNLDYTYITEIGGPLLGYGEGNNLTDITLPDNLQYIGDSTFKGSIYLQTITIPEYVTCLGNYAFLNCESLTLISLPLLVEFIGKDCFKGCTNLVDFYCNSSTPPSLNGCDIFGDYTDIPNLTINVLYLDKYLTNDDWKLYSPIIKLHPKTIGYKAQNEVRLNLRYWNDFSIQSHNYNSGYGVIISNNELVTSVPNNAFLYITEITDVFLPESITRIGSAAFQKCTSLTNICLPKTIQVLGTACFSYTNLSEITLTKSVTQIGQGVFINTPLLRFVYEGTLEDWCKINFSNTLSLYDVASSNPMYYGAEKVYINGENVAGEVVMPTMLNSYCIVHNDLISSIIIPEDTKQMALYPFCKCNSLTKVQWNAIDCQPTDPNTPGVFLNCPNITEFIFGDKVQTIPARLCQACAISEINIPNSVVSIKTDAFKQCKNLTSVTIPNSVLEIGDFAFRACESLTSVVIGNSVTSIGKDAFLGCSSLASMVVAEGNTVYDSRENCNALIHTATNTLFYGCKNTTIPNSVTVIKEYAFLNCSSLTSITIPASVISIELGAFSNCSSLTSVVIENGVESIGMQAFNGCSKLSSLVIPSSVTKIEEYVFNNTAILKNPSNWLNNILYLSDWVINCDTNMLGECIIKDGSVHIANGAFRDCSSLTSIVIPNGVTSIGSNAFLYCNKLTSIVLPDSVTTIDEQAFYRCAITSIVIPSSVTSIGKLVFYYCNKLTDIVIPDSVTSIGYQAFYGCLALQTITFNGTKNQWKSISKDPTWKNYSKISKVLCSDGIYYEY